MWATTATAGLVAGGLTVAVMCRRRQEAPLLTPRALRKRLHRVHSATDAVHLLQRMASRAPTEDVAMHLADAIAHDGVDEVLVVRLSELHRLHGADMGATGYAINMIWGVILEGIASSNVIIYTD
jgi:hypothetical protein